MDSLVQIIRIFSIVIGMEFVIKKCAMLVIVKEKIVKSFGIELSDSKVIKSLQEEKSYKYLVISEANRFLGEEL